MEPMVDAGRKAFPNLFSPMTLGPVQLAHRVIIPGHSMLLGETDGTMGARYSEYLVARAKGGAAMIGIESAPIHPTSQQSPRQLRLWDPKIVDGLKKACEAIHAAGAKVSIILWHGGHNISHYNGLAPLAPSPIPSPVTGEIPKAMTAADITAMVEAYALAARHCAAAGIDAIEVQTSSDYLLGSFLSPKLNRRNDSYGGSLENRARFVVEVLKAVRREASTLAGVGVRTCIEHIIPSDPGGYGAADSLAVMKYLEGLGLVDWVNLMTGSHWDFSEMISPMDFPRAQLAEQSAAFKAALNVPVIVAGRIRTAQEAENIVAKKQADAVAMARTFIADPDWAAKVMDGRIERIRPCMSCNQGCIGLVHRGLAGGCVVNPEAGRESLMPPVTPAATPLKIAVIGGGPAGLECARVAAERGHRVTLYEAADRLGGAMRLAADAPHRGEMKLPLGWWERELKRLGVDIRLGSRVEENQNLDADEMVWAVGAEPAATMVWKMRPSMQAGIPGTSGLPHGRHVLRDGTDLAGRVLVIDEEGGWPAISTVETVAAMPSVSHVTVATAGSAFGQPDLHLSEETTPVARRLRAAKVEIVPGTLVVRVERDADAFHAHTSDGRILGGFDRIVLSTGAAAPTLPDGVTAIGDCVTPRTFWAAVQDGARVGRAL
ncbi:MAG: FAD-dependent oxidoreductase [Rhodobacteraceae bacterium]|nr:FAD-dependent oxidoreductase [Paracoccaceae bacterium]